LGSPAHAANILNPAYHFMGYGYACDGHSSYYVVQFHA
jgi:uncharacterized protein YkwD